MRVEEAATPVPLFPRQVLAIVIFSAPGLCNEKSLPHLHLSDPRQSLPSVFWQAELAPWHHLSEIDFRSALLRKICAPFHCAVTLMSITNNADLPTQRACSGLGVLRAVGPFLRWVARFSPARRLHFCSRSCHIGLSFSNLQTSQCYKSQAFISSP